MKTAGFLRRSLAALIDLPAAVALTALLGVTGVIDATPMSPPNDWFWTEWLLKSWLDAPSLVLTPIAVCIGLATLIFAVGDSQKWSLGNRLMKVRVVDADGARPTLAQFLLRWIGWCLSLATLGLGHLLGLVSPSRRTLADYLSGTAVICDR